MKKVIALVVALVIVLPIQVKEPNVIVDATPNIKIQTVVIKSNDIQIPAPRVYYDVELTGYDNDYACTQRINNIGLTASGVRASRGTIAVPKAMPLGTDVYINGVLHRAEDRGGAIIIKSNGTYIIDVWFPTHAEAVKFGRVKAKMYKENGKYYIEY